jgi:hypothetical protein
LHGLDALNLEKEDHAEKERGKESGETFTTIDSFVSFILLLNAYPITTWLYLFFLTGPLKNAVLAFGF